MKKKVDFITNSSASNFVLPTKVAVPLDEVEETISSLDLRICPDCNGDGLIEKVYDEILVEECSTCSGDGFVDWIQYVLRRRELLK